MRVGTRILLLLLAAVLAGLLVFAGLLAYIAHQAEQDTKARSDAILVLGGTAVSGTDCYGPICKQGFVPKPHYNPCLVARVEHAVSLYKDGYAPKILMSGGTDKGSGVNEADTMQKIAMDAGVPAADILLERDSQSTYQNFLFSKKVLEAAGLHSVIIVSDPYHMARARLMASHQGYAYTVSPDVESTCWTQDKGRPFTNRDSVREALAILFYAFMGKL